jgi:hypothetical protein
VCSIRYHFPNRSTAGLDNRSTARLAGLVDEPLLGCTENRGRVGGGEDLAGRASNKILAHGQWKKMKRLSIFLIFYKFQTNLNSNQIYIFDDFYSHNKM